MGRLVAIGILGIAIGAAVAVFLVPDNGHARAQAPLVQTVDPDNEGLPPDRGEGRPSLPKIAALLDDFERNAVLYRLLADANASDVERLLAEVAALSPTPHRYDIARVLYIHFAALDPAAAADHVVNADYHSSWIAAVFRAWAHKDLEAAVDRAVTLPDDPKAIATRAILELDLPAWQREALAEELGDGSAYGTIPVIGEIMARQATWSGVGDYAAEWEAALRTADATARAWRVALLVRAWVGVDPAAALAWVEGLPDDSIARTARDAFTEVLVSTDPPAALDLLAQTEGMWNVPNTVEILMRGLVEVGIADAIWSLDVVPPRAQRRARRALLNAVANYKDSDFEVVLAWFATLPPAIRADHVAGLAGAYASHDPEGAFVWALALEGGATTAVNNVMFQIGKDDHALGMRLLARIEDPSVRRYAVETLVGAHASQDAQGAWRSAQSFRREEYGPGLLADTLTRWAFTSPNAAMRELLALPPDLRDATIVAIGGTTLLRRLGPARAEEALDVLESESARRRLADGFARYYADTNPDEEKAEFFRHIATPPPR